jgi:hypothetical protein
MVDEDLEVRISEVESHSSSPSDHAWAENPPGVDMGTHSNLSPKSLMVFAPSTILLPTVPSA